MDEQIIITIVVSTLLIALLIAGITFILILSHRRTLQLRLEYEREMSVIQNEVTEQVFTNVAAEIHDNVGQILTFLYMQMENKKMDEPALSDHFTPLQETVSRTTAELRKLSHVLNTESILQKGLHQAIELEVSRLARFKRPVIVFEARSESFPLDSREELICFRIFQESINNILKHAQAANVTIELDSTPHFLLRITDDGKGFEQAQIKAGKGNGLTNMIHRAKMIGMELDIDSAVGKGTRFTLSKSNSK